MDIIQLIDELKAMGEQGEGKWFSRFRTGATVLDINEYFDLLSQLESAVPSEVTTAAQVAQQRDQIIEEAHRERQKIVDSAREQAQLLVSNDSLVIEAQNRAKEIVKQAQVEGDAIKAEAEQWARGIVERLENYVSRIGATVEKTKKAMSTSAPPRGGGAVGP